MKTETSTKQKTTNSIKGAVISRADYEKAIRLFINYKPVKVARELKDDFHKAISKQLIEDGIERWEATLTPFKEYWRFSRKQPCL